MQDKLSKLVQLLRDEAKRSRRAVGGYYRTAEDDALQTTKAEVYDGIAIMIEQAFELES